MRIVVNKTLYNLETASKIELKDNYINIYYPDQVYSINFDNIDNAYYYFVKIQNSLGSNVCLDIKE